VRTSPDLIAPQKTGPGALSGSLWDDFFGDGPSLDSFDELDLEELKRPPSAGASSALQRTPHLTSPELSLEPLPRAEPKVSTQAPSVNTTAHTPQELSEPQLLAPPHPAPPPQKSSQTEPQRTSSSEFDQFEALDALSAPPLEHLEHSDQLTDERALEVRKPESADEGAQAEMSLSRSLWITYHKLWLTCGWLIIIGLSYQTLISTPAFHVREVSFEGAQPKHLSLKELKSLTGLQKRPLNIFELDLSTLEDALRAHPWVKSVELSRALPDQLSARVIEHQARGVLVFDQLYAINAEGALIAPISPKELGALPVISGIPKRLFYNKDKDEIGPYLARLGLEVAALYESMGLDRLASLSEVYVPETGYVELTLGEMRVVVGRAHFKRHFTNLKEVLSSLKRKGLSAQYVLLSPNFNRAIVRETSASAVDELTP
jgi:cell division protein FtsQ